MYKIDIENPIVSWNLLYYGIKSDLLEPKTAIDFASRYIEKNPQEDNPFIISLLIIEDESKSSILSALERLTSPFDEEKIVKVLRYIIIKNLKATTDDNKLLLSILEDVYADFEYSEDMEEFISYMPVKEKGYNPLKHSEKENMLRLISKLNEFLQKEETWINDIYNR